MKLAICLPVAALFAFSPAQAQQFEDLDALDGQVAAVLQGSGMTAQPIDRRLKLSRCPEPVALDDSARDSVALRCAAIGWRIRVPVTGAVKNEPKIAGAPKVESAETGEILVKRGETVELVIRGQDFEIMSSGVAQEDGRMGKQIRVKSSTGTSALGGTVVARGIVHIEG